MSFNFDDPLDRSKLEAQLSAKHDQALKAQDWGEVLRLNALIEKCWLRDDKNFFYMDPGSKPPFIVKDI